MCPLYLLFVDCVCVGQQKVKIYISVLKEVAEGPMWVKLCVSECNIK